MIKKITALVLSLAMVLSLFIVPAYGFGYTVVVPEGGVENEYIDDNMMSMIRVINLAGAWDSVEGMGYRADEIVPRWYMAWYVGNLMKLKRTAPTEFETLFNDLTSEHRNYADIKAVVDAGYMHGYPDRKFRPDQPITAKEAARVLLSALGYDPYIAVTSEAAALSKTNILEGIPADAKELTQAMVLRMFYNALMSPAVRQEKFEADLDSGMVDVEYVFDPEYLGFEHLCGIVFETGVLEGVPRSSLRTSEADIKEGLVTVDGVQYKCDENLLWEHPYQMLGYNINFWYRKSDNDTHTIVYMHKNDKNKTLTLTHNDIEVFENGVYKYYDGHDRKKTATIDNQTAVIYNNIANPGFDEEEMVPDFGTVTFIDNNKEKGYDVVKIDSFEFYYISSVNYDDRTIYDDEAKKFVDFKTADEYIVMTNGSETNLDRLKTGNMAVVQRSSKNSDYDFAVIESVALTAKNVKITSVSYDELSFADSIKAKWHGLQVKRGESYTLFTYDDEVVMAVAAEGGEKYAYLYNAAFEDTVFSNSPVKFRLFDMNGNALVLEGANTVKIDGVGYKNTDVRIRDVLNTSARLSNMYSDQYPVAQPIKYELNGSGKVVSVDTLTLNAASETASGSLTSVEGDDATIYYGINRSLYDSDTKQNNLGVIDNSTVQLFVPVNSPEDDSRDDDDGYWSKFPLNAQPYVTDICDVDGAGVAGAVFFYQKPKLFTERGYFIVSDLVLELGEDGESECRIDGYLRNGKTSYTASAELYESLAVGDIIRVETDKNNKVIDYHLAFGINKDYSNFVDRYNMISGIQNPIAEAFKTMYGTVLDMSGSVLKVSQSMYDRESEVWDAPTTDRVESFYTSNCSFYKYTEVQGRAEIASASINDVTSFAMNPNAASKVFVCMANGPAIVYIVEK